MADRKSTPFTNEHFAAFCLNMIGQPYWYGGCVHKCTESLRARKAEQYPSHYGSSRANRYQQDIAAKKVCADCVGAIKGYAWTNGGVGVLESIGTDRTFTNSYSSNGCPDRTANGMFSYAKSKGMDWGTMSTLPEIVGLALHKDGHVGIYVGNGYAVEWKGFAYGCVKTKVAGRGWTHWYRIPVIQYGQSITQPVVDVPLGSRLLKKGLAGADVKALQELLLQLGYPLPKYGADGEFGTETESAVRMFQADEGLEVDGKHGDKTHAALMSAIADDDEGQQDESQEDMPATKPEPSPNTRRLVIVSDGGKVNIRVGNDTGYARITSVAPGTIFEYVATAPNGWNAIVVNAQVGWVSGQYSRIL